MTAIRTLTNEELKEFERNLREAIAWCHWKSSEFDAPDLANPSDTTNWCRTPILDPHLPKEIVLGAEPLDRMLNASSDIFVKRRTLLEKQKLTPHVGPLNDAKGRLALSIFQDSVWDTAAQVLSAEFFDDVERPPWDTWVFCVRETEIREPGYPHATLVFWVPPTWFEAVSVGIDASPVGNISWLSEVDSALVAQLGKQGLLI